MNHKQLASLQMKYLHAKHRLERAQADYIATQKLYDQAVKDFVPKREAYDYSEKYEHPRFEALLPTLRETFASSKELSSIPATEVYKRVGRGFTRYEFSYAMQIHGFRSSTKRIDGKPTRVWVKN